MTHRAGLILALLCAAGPAAAVGLGPLNADGVTMSDRKGFYVTLINDDRRPDALRLYAIGYGDEAEQPRVMLPSPILTLPANSQRRVLVIASDLTPGETFRFRVCAERADFGQGALIHARVCSKLVARRIG